MMKRLITIASFEIISPPPRPDIVGSTPWLVITEGFIFIIESCGVSILLLEPISKASYGRNICDANFFPFPKALHFLLRRCLAHLAISHKNRNNLFQMQKNNFFLNQIEMSDPIESRIYDILFKGTDTKSIPIIFVRLFFYAETIVFRWESFPRDFTFNSGLF